MDHEDPYRNDPLAEEDMYDDCVELHLVPEVPLCTCGKCPVDSTGLCCHQDEKAMSLCEGVINTWYLCKNILLLFPQSVIFLASKAIRNS